ncbi:MAG: alkane 1-monooxygenase, partial [Bacteroidia bacterium]
SDSPSSRFSLIELSRHSDHHIKASKPYHTLVSHEESPVLPSGYFGMFFIALIPPLWYRMVHPRIPANQVELKLSRQ